MWVYPIISEWLSETEVEQRSEEGFGEKPGRNRELIRGQGTWKC